MILLKPLKISLICCLISVPSLFFIACERGDRAKLVGSATATNRMHPNQMVEVLAHYGGSLRGRVNSIPVLVLRGSYEEMGEAQGVLAGKEIIHSLDEILIPYVNQEQKDAWDTKVLPAARAYAFPQRYERELAGIMLGIKKRFPSESDRMLFSINREISLDDLRALNCFGDMMSSGAGCSSFSAWGPLTESGEVICGRNLDEPYIHIPGKMPFIVFAREPAEPGRQATIEITGPGVIGVSTAMNADGLLVMAHDAHGLNPSASEKWEPRAIVRRDAVESARATNSIGEVAQLFENKPVKLGNSTHIGLPVSKNPNSPLPFVLEWDGNPLNDGVTVRVEDPSIVANAIVCTNHYVKRRPEQFKGLDDSHKRFGILVESLQKVQASKSVISVEKAIKMMDSVAKNGKTVTYLTVIALPGERKMIFSVSPESGVSATKGEWIEITWDRIFGAV
jgi:hypothetical protein